MHILFVCTGNTCRSPIAEALLQDRLQRLGQTATIEVRSAGIKPLPGLSVAAHSLTVLLEYGIRFEHTPQELNRALIAWADLILTMTQYHKWIIIAGFPETLSKTFTLKEFAGSQDALDIDDPIGQPLDRYRQCAQEINQSLDVITEHLIELASQPSDRHRIGFPSPQPLPRLFPLLRCLVRLFIKAWVWVNERSLMESD